jgi:ferredoxin--NADP+ reductase
LGCALPVEAARAKVTAGRGGCRVIGGGKVRFACVDGPKFAAHKVEFDELTRRTRAWLEQERLRREQHECRTGLGKQ